MADTGWVSPGTIVSDDTVGTLTWTNPNNAKTEGSGSASAEWTTSANLTSEYLKATNFGFEVPSGAIIDGIEARIKKGQASGGMYISDSSVKIVKSDGTIGSTNKALAGTWPFDFEMAYYTYGASDNLWDETWSNTDINDSDFGVVISGNADDNLGGTAFVDHIQIKVYYTEGDTPIIGNKYPLPAFKNIV